MNDLLKLLLDSPREYEGYLLNALPSIPDPRDYKYSNLFVTSATLPEIIDYRPLLPPVFDQKQRGSCTACASVWTVKAYQEIKQNDYPNGGLSASHLYTLCKQNDGIPEIEGTYPRTAMQMLQKYGVCLESIMPYSVLTSLPSPKVPSIPSIANESAIKFKINTYAQLCANGDAYRDSTLNIFRTALKNEGPFMIALMIYDNFTPDSYGKLPLPSGNLRGGHAVGIVGDLPDKKCLILRNSWGSSWGVNGYAYLPYEWITSKTNGGWDIYEGWSAVDMIVNKPASRIEIVPDASSILVGGLSIYLDVPATIINNRLLLPVRKLAENMGYVVDWDGKKAILTKIS